MNAQILKNIVSVFIVLIIFVVSFYLGGGFKMLIADKNQDVLSPKISKEIPSYKDKVFLPMGNKISVNNLPMELGYFTTKDELSAVRDELMKRFREANLKPYYTQVSDEEGFIQATDRLKGEHRIVILKRVEDETMVFAGITPVMAENLIVKPDSSLGIPSDAINYVEVKNQDYGRYARTISFQMRGFKEKNISIYKDSLKSLGFSENEHFKNANVDGVFVFEKDNIQIMAVITESEDEKGELTSFVLNVMEKKDE